VDYLQLLLPNLKRFQIDLPGRRFVLYLNKNCPLTLSTGDYNATLAAIAKNYPVTPNRRSIYHPLAGNYHCPDFPWPITGLQLKGIAFSSHKRLEIYNGIGVCPEYYYSQQTGQLRKIFQFDQTREIECARVGKEAEGAMDFCEAVKEFFFTNYLTELPLSQIYVKIPIGFGYFEDLTFDNGRLGFEILGTSLKYKQRNSFYLAGLRAYQKTNQFDVLKSVIYRRAQVLSQLHQTGYLVPFLTLDNLQVPAQIDFTILHDIGDSRFLNIHLNKLSPDQFLAESFWNLVYILSPNRAILPGAPHYELSMLILNKNAKELYQSTICGYFGNLAHAVLAAYSLADFLHLFQQMCHSPVSQIHSSLLDLFRLALSYPPQPPEISGAPKSDKSNLSL